MLKLPTGTRLVTIGDTQYLTPIEGADAYNLYAQDGSLFRQIILPKPPPPSISIPVPAPMGPMGLTGATPELPTLEVRRFVLRTRWLPGGIGGPMYSYKAAGDG